MSDEEGQEPTAKIFYERLDGMFAVIEILRKDRIKVDKLILLLHKLDVHQRLDKDLLRRTWKNYDRTNVRRYMSKN